MVVTQAIAPVATLVPTPASSAGGGLTPWLFGAFVVWSVITFATRRAHDRAAGKQYPPGSLAKDAIAAIAGAAFALVFAFFLHGPLIGLRPFG